MSCGPAMIWFIQVCVFFESLAECSLVSPMYVWLQSMSRDVIDGSTLVLFRCFDFRVIFVDPSSRIWVHRSRKGRLLSFSGLMVNLMCGSIPSTLSSKVS